LSNTQVGSIRSIGSIGSIEIAVGEHSSIREISRGWAGTRSICTADSKIGAKLAEAISVQEHGKIEMQVQI
jgi:hypothetical protein